MDREQELIFLFLIRPAPIPLSPPPRYLPPGSTVSRRHPSRRIEITHPRNFSRTCRAREAYQRRAGSMIREAKRKATRIPSSSAVPTRRLLQKRTHRRPRSSKPSSRSNSTVTRREPWSLLDKRLRPSTLHRVRGTTRAKIARSLMSMRRMKTRSKTHRISSKHRHARARSGRQ